MTVLLLGSTGKVGPHVAQALLRRGADVRVLTRDPERASAVLPSEVEIVGGYYKDVAANLTDVSAVLLLSEHGPQMQDVQCSVLEQVSDPTVRIVKISGSDAIIKPDGPDAGQQHWAVEQQLATGPNPWVILRPNAFMQTLVAGTAATITTGGFVANPIGSAGITLIDAVDIGEAAAVALLSDGEHDGKIARLTGGRVYTYSDVAAAIGETIGQEITVKDVSPQSLGEAIQAKGASQWEAEHLAHMLSLFAEGVSENVSDDFHELTGDHPRTVEDYLADNISLFSTKA